MILKNEVLIKQGKIADHITLLSSDIVSSIYTKKSKKFIYPLIFCPKNFVNRRFKIFPKLFNPIITI